MPFDNPPENDRELFRRIITDRRERAAVILRAVPDEKFDLSSWKNLYNDRSPACGTTACAMGWLAEVGFEGLELCQHGFVYYPFHGPCPNWVPFRNSDWGQRAAAQLFGLSRHRSEELFIDGEIYQKPRYKVTGADVAEHLLKSKICYRHMKQELEMLNAV